MAIDNFLMYEYVLICVLLWEGFYLAFRYEVLVLYPSLLWL